MLTEIRTSIHDDFLNEFVDNNYENTIHEIYVASQDSLQCVYDWCPKLILNQNKDEGIDASLLGVNPKD